MNPEIQRRRDDEDAAGLEDAEDLVERPADLEDVLERLDAEHRAGRVVGQADRRDVLDAIDAGTRPHVAADVLLAREQAAKVGVALLALDLVRAELEDRAGAVERLGHEAAERLVVVAHRRGSSLSRARAEGNEAVAPQLRRPARSPGSIKNRADDRTPPANRSSRTYRGAASLQRPVVS